ncbi:hypothetical protein [Nostoc sp.]|uniref:hypothetical protein n=1 Tax=Nostoc sp. TaxID=1180 RepID=UPI00359482C9
MILDIGAIATGFVLRAYAGAAANGIILSAWFLLCTATLALFLGIEKRKAELRLAQIRGNKSRSVLKDYSLLLLARMENVVTTSTVVTYALWSADIVLLAVTRDYLLPKGVIERETSSLYNLDSKVSFAYFKIYRLIRKKN